jgi:hypothetical protein
MSDDSHDAGGPDRVAIEAVKANGRSSTTQAGPLPTDCQQRIALEKRRSESPPMILQSG